MDFLWCVSLVHREFDVHFFGDCDSQGLACSVEANKGACSLFLLKIPSDSGAGEPIAVT